MNLETIQIPAFVTALFAVASFIVIPISAMAMSKVPSTVTAESSDSTDGAACNLPPELAIDGKDTKAVSSELPPIDMRATSEHKTATFALG